MKIQIRHIIPIAVAALFVCTNCSAFALKDGQQIASTGNAANQLSGVLAKIMTVVQNINQLVDKRAAKEDGITQVIADDKTAVEKLSLRDAALANRVCDKVTEDFNQTLPLAEADSANIEFEIVDQCKSIVTDIRAIRPLFDQLSAEEQKKFLPEKEAALTAVLDAGTRNKSLNDRIPYDSRKADAELIASKIEEVQKKLNNTESKPTAAVTPRSAE